MKSSTYMSDPVSSEIFVVVDVDSPVLFPVPRQQSARVVSIEKVVIKVDCKVVIVTLKRIAVKK